MRQHFSCSRSAMVVAGLLSGAMLLSGLKLATAAPAPVPKQDAPNKEEPKKNDRPMLPGFPNIDDLIPKDVPPEVADRIRKQLEQAQEQLKRLQEEGVNPGAWRARIPGFAERGGRLGAMVRTPDPTLAEQLDLPRNQGLVVGDVQGGSPAAKAGLKPNDVLLELNGKPVPNDPRDFVRMIDDLKANTPVDVVVMRKGKKETVKGLSIPEMPKPRNPLGLFPGAFPGAGVTSRTNITRTDDSFRATYQEGPVSITVTGTINQGKATVGEIAISDRGETKKYKSVEDVPENHREEVKHLIRKSEASAPKRAIPID